MLCTWQVWDENPRPYGMVNIDTLGESENSLREAIDAAMVRRGLMPNVSGEARDAKP